MRWVYPVASGFAIGSVEGRIAMEYFDLDERVQAKVGEGGGGGCKKLLLGGWEGQEPRALPLS